MMAPSSLQCSDGALGTPTKNRIGAAIRAIRKRLGLTQIAFSETLSIKQNSLSRFETGQVKPSTERLIHLLRFALTEDEREPLVTALNDRGILASDLAVSAATSVPTVSSIAPIAGGSNV